MADSYKELTEEESDKIHSKMLSTGNIDMRICAERLLSPNETSASLPLFFEDLISDRSIEEVLNELISFYCKVAPMKYKIEQMLPFKRTAPDDTQVAKIKRKRRSRNHINS